MAEQTEDQTPSSDGPEKRGSKADSVASKAFFPVFVLGSMVRPVIWSGQMLWNDAKRVGGYLRDDYSAFRSSISLSDPEFDALLNATELTEKEAKLPESRQRFLRHARAAGYSNKAQLRHATKNTAIAVLLAFSLTVWGAFTLFAYDWSGYLFLSLSMAAVGFLKALQFGRQNYLFRTARFITLKDYLSRPKLWVPKFRACY
ncbi:hypothetical protein [Rhodovibrio sodomensis]|nr:hypothetical protein [Rhodovibrio sodomensis]